MCACETDKLPHLLSDGGMSIPTDDVESWLWSDAVNVTRDRLRLSQFEIDFLSIDLVDDKCGQESERMVLVGGFGVGYDTDLVEGEAFVVESECNGTSKGAVRSPDDGKRGGRHGER